MLGGAVAPLVYDNFLYVDDEKSNDSDITELQPLREDVAVWKKKKKQKLNYSKNNSCTSFITLVPKDFCLFDMRDFSYIEKAKKIGDEAASFMSRQ